MKRTLLQYSFLILSLMGSAMLSTAQNLHFSQYYNAPLLVNPANAGLMSEKDYRVGANYRNQWSQIVPYQTTSFFGDLQLFHGNDRRNWLGLGGAFYQDKAGDGNLKLTRFQMFAAYHLQMGYYSMLSAGLYGGYTQRSVDFSKLTWGTQWTGFSFDRTLSNQEPINGIVKTSYMDAGAGINYAYFPNENTYIKVGAGVSHVNMPTESFYEVENQIGIRPSLNADGLFKFNDIFILNPSVYASYQQGAYEIVYGTMLKFWLGGEDTYRNELILGVYNRWGDAIIPTFGFDFGSCRVMANYDYTMSGFKDANNGRGAIELSLVYLGNYVSGNAYSRRMNCPRF